jgi:hypothetical protein
MMFPRLHSLILFVLCYGVVKCTESELNIRPGCSNAVIQDDFLVNRQGSVERVQSSINSVRNSSWSVNSNQNASEEFISSTADLSSLNEDKSLQANLDLSLNVANDPLLTSLHALVSIRGTDGNLQENENDNFYVNYNPSSSNVLSMKRVVFDDSDSDSEDDIVNSMVNSMVDELLESDIGHLEDGVNLIRNKDGSIKKRKRDNYDRCAKRQKPNHPENTNLYMLLISHPNVSDPSSSQGKQFRKMFRTPYPVFTKIVDLCRAIPGKVFNYGPKGACGELSIPLEIKVLTVLR